MKMSKKAVLTISIAVGIVLSLAVVAWACTASAYISAAPVEPGRRSATVSLSNFGPTPVEIRWETAGGPLLGTFDPKMSSVEVLLPGEATDGVYFLVAISRNADGTLVSKAAAPIEIKGGSGAESSRNGTEQLWSGFASDSGSLSEPRAGGQGISVNQSTEGPGAGGIALLAYSLTAGGIVALGMAAAAFERRRSRA